MSQKRQINLQSVRSIMNKRVHIKVAQVGKRVRLYIQGNGTVVPVLDKEGKEVLSTVAGEGGVVLEKKILNLRAASELGLKNPRNAQFLKDGAAAEKAGDTVKADELLSQFLNATQMSFGVITGTLADKLTDGVEIAATIQKIDTEKGSLLTIDTSTIQVLEPEVAETMDFNIDDFMTEEEEPVAPKAKARRTA